MSVTVIVKLMAPGAPNIVSNGVTGCPRMAVTFSAIFPAAARAATRSAGLAVRVRLKRYMM